MSTRKRDRFFALFGAILFLGTSSALAIAIIVSNVQSRHQDDGATSKQDASSSSSTKKLTGTTMDNFTPLTTPLTALQVSDTKVGNGTEVKAGDTITADYVGALADNGKIFDASADHGGAQTFSLTGVIAGWSQGIPGMRIGGTRRLLIPANLGYGTQGTTGIPPNSDLVFDVTVQAIGE